MGSLENIQNYYFITSYDTLCFQFLVYGISWLKHFIMFLFRCSLPFSSQWLDYTSQLCLKNYLCNLISNICTFPSSKGSYIGEALQCECTEHYWTVYLEILNMVNFMLCISYYNQMKKRKLYHYRAMSEMKTILLDLKIQNPEHHLRRSRVFHMCYL